MLRVNLAFKTLATCFNAERNIFNGLSCGQGIVVTTRYSTRPRRLKLAYSDTLPMSVLGKFGPFLSPVKMSAVGTRLYAADDKQKESSIEEQAKSQSILTRLLEEERQQPKAVTVAERGAYLIKHPIKVFMIIFSVVQAGKDTTYLLVICVGFGIAAVLLYYVFGELFSSNSVQRLFSAALARIKADEKVKH